MSNKQSLSLALTEDEIDCLQELMNISYGEATAAIAKVINRRATLDIPSIKDATAQEFNEYFINKFDNVTVHYVTNQQIDGTLSGETMFVMDETSLRNLALELGIQAGEINEYELKDVLLEIYNIVTSTTLSKLAELINATISFSSPCSKVIQNVNNLDNRYETKYHHIIIISTMIKFEEQHIEGELLIMSKDDSFIYMKKALNTMIEEY